MSPKIKSRLEELLNEEIRLTKSVSGGCIADSIKIELFSGKVFFLKQLRSKNVDIFNAEAYGLELLSKSQTVSVPRVIDNNSDYLLLEWIEVGGQTHHSIMERLGYEFAKLHKFRGEKFGLEIDNYLGKTPQLNTPTKKGSSHWSTFFIENRILFQVELAKKNGFSNPEFLNLIDNLIDKIPDILAGTEEEPSLLHGDLWSGNYLIDVSGTPWLIDPAVYFGHREADLAMTSLFGGFNKIFYSAYNSGFPILPEYSDREPIYQLYHLLNHLNLFGSSYYGKIISILKKYL